MFLLSSLQAWSTIIDKLRNNKMEFPTTPKIDRAPVWFSARVDGETIVINEAIVHQPSSKLSTPRRLTYKDFEKVYPIYLRRENDEQVSAEATAATLNQVYYYSLIKHLCQ